MANLSIYDPIEVPNGDSWFPANDASAALVAALEPCKNMTRLVDVLEASAPLADARGLTLLATPLVSFADNVFMLSTLLAKEDRSSWPASDRDILKESSRALNRARMGPLRVIRNKRSAHHDCEAYGVPRPSSEMFLSPMFHGLRVVILLLNHERSYWWTRTASDGQNDRVTIFGEVATTFRIDESKNILGIEKITFMRDPRYAAKEIIQAAIARYNRLVDFCAASGAHLKIVLRGG